MILSTFIYFYDNSSDDNEQLLSLDQEINIEEFYLDPPADLVKNTMNAILSL